MSYRYQTIYNRDIPKYKNELAEFFLKLSYDKNYPIAIENSAFICICLYDGTIIGACRAVSDMSRFAYIVDLNVEKSHQRQGVGTQLVKNMVQECVNKNIQYIETSTDPNFPWLENFYAKIGFTKITNSVSMKHSKKNTDD